jgi:hypothetical protein
MNYASEMCSDAMIHVPSFIKIGLGIQKLEKRGFTHTRARTHTHTGMLML